MRIFISIGAALAAAFPLFASGPEGIHIESLTAQSIEMERRLYSQDLFFADRELEEYLNDILEKLATSDEISLYRPRVRVLRSNTVNAFAAPHGVIYICTGLLARITSEGQAAALLGHEFAHIINHHAAKNLFVMKESARANVPVQQGLALLLGDGIAGSVTGAALRAAVSGYSRELEREADSAGLARMAAAGYPHREFLGIFEMLKDYIVTERIKEPYFFSSHPRILERLENYRRIVGGVEMVDKGNCQVKTAGGENNRENAMDRTYFDLKLRDVLLYDAGMNLAAGKFETAGDQLDRLLAADSGDIAALVMRGNMERMLSRRGTDAMKWYEKALRLDPGNLSALRAMGYAYHSIGAIHTARGYLRRYCELAGDAADIKMAREALRQCENE